MNRAELTFTDDVAVITLHGDTPFNTLDDGVIDQLHLHLDDVARSDAAALFLRGGGSHFSAGGDLAHLTTLADVIDTPEGRAHVTERLRHNAAVTEKLLALDVVTVALIDGACVGAALGLASACDLRLATSRTILSTGFLQLGLSADFGTAVLLPRVIGASRAAQWLLAPTRRSADEGLASGFLAAIVEADALEDHACTLTRDARRCPVGTASMKSTLRAASRMQLATELDAEVARFVKALSDPRSRAAIAAAQR